MTNPEIQRPSEIIRKWQEIVALLAEITYVPSALVMNSSRPTLQFFPSSESNRNPYDQGDVASLSPALCCETVMKTRQQPLVHDALVEEEWKSNADTKLGMIS